MSLRVPPIEGPAPVAAVRDRPGAASQPVEASVLAVRDPRRRPAPPPTGTERRRRPKGPDPAGAKVLLLLVPDGKQLPPDLDRADYRVVVRFVKRG